MIRVGRQTVKFLIQDMVGMKIRFPNALATAIIVQRLQESVSRHFLN